MDIIGLNAHDPEWYQVITRTIIVFVIALLFVRISGMRTFGTQSAFDVTVTITLGAMLSRAVTGHYPFFNCIGAAGLLVILHRATAYLSAKNKLVNSIIEGKPVLLFTNGKLLRGNLKKNGISEKDILRALHEENLDSLKMVKQVILETDGTISVVKKEE